MPMVEMIASSLCYLFFTGRGRWYHVRPYRSFFSTRVRSFTHCRTYLLNSSQEISPACQVMVVRQNLPLDRVRHSSSLFSSRVFKGSVFFRVIVSTGLQAVARHGSSSSSFQIFLHRLQRRVLRRRYTSSLEQNGQVGMVLHSLQDRTAGPGVSLHVPDRLTLSAPISTISVFANSPWISAMCGLRNMVMMNEEIVPIKVSPRAIGIPLCGGDDLRIHGLDEDMIRKNLTRRVTMFSKIELRRFSDQME